MQNVKRWIAAAAVAALAIGAAVVAITATAGGNNDPAAKLTAFSTGTPVTLSPAKVEALRSSGVDLAADGDVVTVAAPSGDGRWTVAQSADGACLVVPQKEQDSAVCGTTALLRRGGLVGFTPDAEASASLGIPENLAEAKKGDTAPKAPAGTATFRGLVANDVVTVAAVTKDGKALVSDAVKGNSVYELRNVPFGEVDTVQFTHTDGATNSVPVR